MVLIALTTVVLCALAIYAVVRASRAAMHRLGLDPMPTLLWLGLAERPTGPPPPRPTS